MTLEPETVDAIRQWIAEGGEDSTDDIPFSLMDMVFYVCFYGKRKTWYSFDPMLCDESLKSDIDRLLYRNEAGIKKFRGELIKNVIPLTKKRYAGRRFKDAG